MTDGTKGRRRARRRGAAPFVTGILLFVFAFAVAPLAALADDGLGDVVDTALAGVHEDGTAEGTPTDTDAEDVADTAEGSDAEASAEEPTESAEATPTDEAAETAEPEGTEADDEATAGGASGRVPSSRGCGSC